MLKLGLIFGGLGLVLALIIHNITSFLVIDDLAKCSAPVLPGHVCAPADAIVAISGGDTAARAQEAIKLYQAGWAPVIVFSGAALDKTGPSNAAVMRAQALTAGVPASDILIEESAVDTAQNASNTVRILTDARRIILVTSPYHQHRASLEFQHIFGERVQIVNHPAQNDYMWPPTWYLTASGWWLAISEVIKTMVVAL